MDTETRIVVTINYLLDEDGRREALALGMQGMERQTIVLGADDEYFDAALALASVSTVGEAVLNVGHISRESMCMKRVTSHGIQTPVDQNEKQVVLIKTQRWSAPQAVMVLVGWEANRQTRVKQINAASAKESAVLAEQERVEAAAKRKSILEGARDDDLEILAQIVREMSLEEAENETITRAIEHARENISDMQFHIASIPNVRRAFTEHREQIKRDTWVSEQGSDRLRRCVTEGIECDAIYRDERLAYERPGWRWAADVRGNKDVPRNPSVEAFALLDEARTFDGAAGIEYWTARERATDEAGYDEDLMPREFRGYVATARLLGREIVFFGADQDVPEL